MKIPKSVYDILDIKEEDPSKLWLGGIHNIENISYQKLEQILAILGEEFYYDSHNNAYSIGEFLETFKNYADRTTFSGYIVSPTREDERISIDQVTTVKTDENILSLRYADELNIEDDKLHAWWD